MRTTRTVGQKMAVKGENSHSILFHIVNCFNYREVECSDDEVGDEAQVLPLVEGGRNGGGEMGNNLSYTLCPFTSVGLEWDDSSTMDGSTSASVSNRQQHHGRKGHRV